MKEETTPMSNTEGPKQFWKLDPELPEGTGASRRGQCLPISVRLVNPGRAGLLLGPFPRLGALDDHCLYPSTRDLRLKKGK